MNQSKISKNQKRQKKYMFMFAALIALTGLGLAGAVNAQSTTPSSGQPSAWGMHGGPGGMRGMMPGAFGKVTAISGDTITVAGKTGFGSTATDVTYTVDATNATVTKNGTASSVGDIAVGDQIFASGTVSGTNVTATTIRDGMPPRPNVFGKVTAIDGNTITIAGKSGFGSNASDVTYTVDVTNATVTKNGASSSVSDIAVGDTVAIMGTVSGTNVTATSVNDGIMRVSRQGGMGGQGGMGSALSGITGNGEPIVAGTVSSVSGETIDITNKSNVSYTVDATNAKFTKGPTAASISDIAVGDQVVIQGTVNGTSITASSVIDQGQPASTTSGTSGSSTGGTPQHRGFFGSIGSFFSHLFGF